MTKTGNQIRMHFNSPLSSSKADELIELLELNSKSRVIDVGCGTGEFLIRVVQRYSAHGMGVDINADSVEKARSSAANRIPGSSIEFNETDIRKFDAEPNSFDCGICIGASHAYAMDEPAYPETLRGLSRVVRPGGQLLIGESFWMQTPPHEYIEFIGEPIGTYRTHLENVELAKESGLIPYYCITSNLDEWDDFEWRHNIRKEQEAVANSDDPKTVEMLARSRDWRMAYLSWGRGTLGFAYYLFLKPE